MAVEIKLSGPVFQNPTPAVQAAIQKGLLQAALLGQRLVQEQLRPGHGVRTGTFRRSVVGAAGSWQHATVGSALIYTGFPGYGMFASAEQQLAGQDLAGTIGAEVAKVLNC